MSGSGFSIPPYMQQNSVGSNYSLNGELPPEIALKEQALNRRQQIANLMTQNSMRPLQGGMAGRFYVPPSAFQGLAQLGEAAGGAYINSQVDKGRTDLAGENQRVMSDAIQQYIKDTSGKEAQPGAPVETPLQGPGAPVMHPEAAGQRQNFMDAAVGPNFAPEGQKYPEVAAAMYQQSLGKAQELYPDKTEGSQPTAMIPGPGTPAQPATAQDRFLAGMKLRGTLGPAANPFLQMAQHTHDMEEQRAFQTKEHEATRASQNEQRRLDRENKIFEIGMRLDDKSLDREARDKLETRLAALHEDAKNDRQKQHDETLQHIAAQARAEGGKPPSGYRFTKDGNLEAIPGGPGDQKTPGAFKPPAGYRFTQQGDLEPIPGGPADKVKNLTEAQGKSNLYATRADEANNIMNDLEGKYSPLGLNAKLKSGVFEAPANAMLSDSSQKAEQAQRNFVNAVLRQESGAVINPDEFDNARKQYFPQPGDGKEVLLQKKQNRQTAIEGLKAMAGPAKGAPKAEQYTETRTLPDGRKLGKKADGSIVEIK